MLGKRGSNPPLPRNCERTCLGCRRIGFAGGSEEIQPELARKHEMKLSVPDPGNWTGNTTEGATHWVRLREGG